MSPLVPRPPSSIATDTRHLLLLEREGDAALSLAPTLRQFNYEVRSVDEVGKLAAALATYMPDALIVDTTPPGHDAILTELTRLAQEQALPPMIIVSAVDDFASRLAGLRAGGLAYFAKPVELDRLSNTIDVLTSIRRPEPYRVLLADDSVATAAYHATILRQAGMIPHVVDDPARILGAVAEFGPDMILADTCRPGYSGDELAALLRQYHNYIGIPIVFLVDEDDCGRLASDCFGGDGILVKPVDPSRLVAAIRLRASHHRRIRALLERDPLTGLFNYTTTKQFLTTELRRVQRYGGRLAFALIDIDHLRRVNYDYGHPAGDRVIRSLATLLTQRLRHSDVVGRYDGENFAAVLTGTSGAEARLPIEDVRATFGRVPVQVDGQSLAVTCSAGIVDADGFADATSLGDVAQRALALAKERGRNCVVLAGDDDAAQSG